jgi:hypothetical protein
VLTEFVGRIGSDGLWEIDPRDHLTVAAAVDEMRSNGELIRIRARSLTVLRGYPRELGEAIDHYIDRAEKAGEFEITFRRELRGGPREIIKRGRNITRKFPLTGEFQLPVDAALLLLNRYPYNLIFEEIEEALEDKPTQQAQPKAQRGPKPPRP